MAERMTYRERFVRHMHFEPVDRAPYYEWLGWWPTTINEWHKQGLPRDVHVWAYFGFDRREGVPLNFGFLPPYDVEVIEETEKYRVYRDGRGIVKREFKDDPGRSMPEWLDFPLKTRLDWEDMKRRLNPESPARYPMWWEDLKRCYEGRDYPLGIHTGSLYGWTRDLMGVERISYMLYDDPGFVEEIMEYWTEFVLAVIRRAVEEVDIDYAHFWEDMCYNAGPLISPEMFEKLMVPRYKRITEFLRSHGIDIIMVDSDGDIRQLVPLWLEAGINCFYPLERASNVDPVELRKQYGKDILLIGGVDKRALKGDKREIEKEVERLVPLVEEGGFIFSVDHCVPPDVPLRNYEYYLELVRKANEGRFGA